MVVGLCGEELASGEADAIVTASDEDGGFSRRHSVCLVLVDGGGEVDRNLAVVGQIHNSYVEIDSGRS